MPVNSGPNFSLSPSETALHFVKEDVAAVTCQELGRTCVGMQCVWGGTGAPREPPWSLGGEEDGGCLLSLAACGRSSIGVTGTETAGSLLTPACMRPVGEPAVTYRGRERA